VQAVDFGLNRILANDNPEEEAESRLWAAPGLPLSAFKVENCMPKEERSAISTPLRDFFPSPRLPRARYTATISLRPDKEPKEIFDDGCQLKLYLARLITRLSYAHSATFIAPSDCSSATQYPLYRIRPARSVNTTPHCCKR
jgi:hypothetical protein